MRRAPALRAMVLLTAPWLSSRIPYRLVITFGRVPASGLEVHEEVVHHRQVQADGATYLSEEPAHTEATPSVQELAIDTHFGPSERKRRGTDYVSDLSVRRVWATSKLRESRDGDNLPVLRGASTRAYRGSAGDHRADAADSQSGGRHSAWMRAAVSGALSFVPCAHVQQLAFQWSRERYVERSTKACRGRNRREPILKRPPTGSRLP